MEFFGKFIDKDLIPACIMWPRRISAHYLHGSGGDLGKIGREIRISGQMGIDLQTEHERYITEKVFKNRYSLRIIRERSRPLYAGNDDNKPWPHGFTRAAWRDHRRQQREERMPALEKGWQRAGWIRRITGGISISAAMAECNTRFRPGFRAGYYVLIRYGQYSRCNSVSTGAEKRDF